MLTRPHVGRPESPSSRLSGAGRSAARFRRTHVHWFRFVGEDPYSSSGLYACRCGVVRPGL